MAGRKDSPLDLARQIGLYNAEVSGGNTQPLSGPLTQSPHTALARGALPAHLQAAGVTQPMSAPHPRYGAPNPTREDIAHLIEGSETRGVRSRSNSAGSASSLRSGASFDPSSVDEQQSWESAGSYSGPRSRGATSITSARSGGGSSTGSAALFSQQSTDSTGAAVGAPQRPHGVMPLPITSYGGDDTALREQLPLELRTFGAPPEYAEVRSQPTRATNAYAYMNTYAEVQSGLC